MEKKLPSIVACLLFIAAATATVVGYPRIGLALFACFVLVASEYIFNTLQRQNCDARSNTRLGAYRALSLLTPVALVMVTWLYARSF